jgi:hypothetical protein
VLGAAILLTFVALSSKILYLVNNELVGMWKAEIVVYFDVDCQPVICPKRKRETAKHSVMTAAVSRRRLEAGTFRT